MRHRPKQRGFTIIETLIFLVVSASVFAGAIGQYTSQQHQVDFRQGVRSLQSQLESMINEVGTSYTPTIAPLKCEALPDNSALTFGTAPGVNDNPECVFLGRVLAMGTTTACANDTTPNCQQYSDIPLAGRRQSFIGGIGKPVETLAGARPTAMAKCTTNGTGTYNFPCGNTMPSLVTRPNIAQRGAFSKDKIGVYKVFVRDVNGLAISETGAIAFLINLNSSNGNVANSVNLATIPHVDFKDNSETKVVNAIASMASPLPADTESSFLNPANGVTLCIIGQYDQKAAITVGANNGQLDVVVQPQDKLDPGCSS